MAPIACRSRRGVAARPAVVIGRMRFTIRLWTRANIGRRGVEGPRPVAARMHCVGRPHIRFEGTMRTNTLSFASCPPLNRSWMQPSSSTFCMLASVCSKGRPNERQVPYIHGRRLHGHRRTCIFGCSQQVSRASDGFPMSSPHGLAAAAAHAVCVATIDRLPLSMPYRVLWSRCSQVWPSPICSHLGQVSRASIHVPPKPALWRPLSSRPHPTQG